MRRVLIGLLAMSSLACATPRPQQPALQVLGGLLIAGGVGGGTAMIATAASANNVGVPRGAIEPYVAGGVVSGLAAVIAGGVLISAGMEKRGPNGECHPASIVCVQERQARALGEPQDPEAATIADLRRQIQVLELQQQLKEVCARSPEACTKTATVAVSEPQRPVYKPRAASTR